MHDQSSYFIFIKKCSVLSSYIMENLNIWILGLCMHRFQKSEPIKLLTISGQSLTSYFFVLISVPPDVRNWFSSYEYESPAINTSYEFSSQPPRNVFDEECIIGKEDKLIRATKAVQKK